MNGFMLNPWLDIKRIGEFIYIKNDQIGLNIKIGANYAGLIDKLRLFQPESVLKEGLSPSAFDFFRQTLILVPEGDMLWCRQGIFQQRDRLPGNPFQAALTYTDSADVLFGVGYARPVAASHPAQGPGAIRRYLKPGQADLGDIIIAPDETHQQIGARINLIVSELLHQERRPVMLGGDHSVTYHAVRAISAHRPVSLVMFDAHTDRYARAGRAEPLTHANVVQQLLDHQLVQQVMIVGVRDELMGAVPAAPDPRVTVIPACEAEFLSPSCFASMLHSDTDWYLSIDLDVLDPAFAPDVATPVIGGLSLHAARRLVRAATQHSRIVGVDVVEVCASTAPYHRTAHAAATLLEDALRSLT
ncbi:arginase family protein [Deinococcus soli (ex Cha et al. 2016)]|uniref:Arginase family enzyme n=2 Tax=Deinococcus soli (ex Cha et al. 2016) TaxID=1309411 RepID=A0AAE3XJ40_9DEIO|nr:arginase family protein [Deinococcus soli (ex Cha et al. 2016)]MDR6221439.1 arginase family enzyme [Deinococcus soli (ex Cha et al. 2016)]MDR6331432.1 arginase family enzyme [Deinococcus soli (ex Cha et al. 2016)]MDR6754591.1 arginase family enzyme [Deinococcus soli (ex Cha et al. 2016)]